MLPFPAIERIIRSCCTAEKPVLLLDYLSKRFDYLSHAGWSEQLEQGRLLINGIEALSGQIVRSGDLIEYMPETINEPPVSWEIEELYEDQNLVVLNKPANLPCHPSGAFFNHTLWAWLKQVKKISQPHLCNRLDRESSGLLLVAKNKACAKLIADALQHPATRRIYCVLVHGDFPLNLEARGYLLPDTTSPVRKKMRFIACEQKHKDQAGQYVHTSFQRLSYDSDRDISSLQAILHSGRTHQIRASLCSLGYPVLGDKLYGLDEGCFLRFAEGRLTSRDKELLQLPRQALHAWKLSLVLSGHEEPCCYEAELPQNWGI
ncbi:MAG: RluA family pseudouridine synthase [Oligosphaeraceae bacterium]|nr:RluA family pseudouridine synthase [Oligosphaeraceae bacterium]